MPVAYNPYDPEQRAFLAALAKGESGGVTGAATVGTGGKNLSGYAVDQYGFPQWEGQGDSHAAGIFQFQPGTWSEIASKYGLNFANPQDQAQGAWYLAQERYAAKTGHELDADLDKGAFSSIQSALQGTWTSANGNASMPQGLAYEIANGVAGGTGTLPWEGSPMTPTAPGGGGIMANVEGFFVRFGLIIVGVLIIGVALWMLLSSQGIVPSPSKVAKLAAVAI